MPCWFTIIILCKFQVKEEDALVFYNEIMLLNVMQEEPMVALIENLEEFGVFCKPYFSSELKEIYNENPKTSSEPLSRFIL